MFMYVFLFLSFILYDRLQLNFIKILLLAYIRFDKKAPQARSKTNC